MKKKRPKIFRKRILWYMLIIVFLVGGVIVWVSAPVRQKIESSKTTAKEWFQTAAFKMAEVAGFSVDNIQIEGLKYTSKLDVLKILNVNYGDNMFAVDTHSLLESLKKIEWIEHVTVQKKFPNTIDILIKEYRPFALWQHKNRVMVITETGVVIPKADPKHFSELSLVVGEKANLQCKGLFAILMDYPGFKDMIVSAQYVQGRRWRLYFSTNIIVDLPELEIGNSLHKLYEMHQKQKILDRDVEIIDMRVPNKLVFKGSKNIRRTKKLTQQGV